MIDAVALLDALALDRVHVVGHDWGAVVGWHLAAGHADRVRSLTAISVPHPAAVHRARRTGDQKERSAYMKLFAIEGKAEEVLLAEDARRLWALFAPLSRSHASKYVQPMLEPGALTGALNWYRRLERPTLGPVSVPVTFVWGGQDLAVGRTAAEGCVDFVAAEKDYRFVELADVGHWVPDLAPDIVAAEVLARAAG